MNACFVIKDIELYERPVKFRLPFRYGIVTLTEAPQAFIRIRIELNGKSAHGMAAELLAPKWFDKNIELTNEENFAQLRRSLHIAREAYLSSSVTTAFQLFSTYYPEQVKTCTRENLNPLIAGYGQALLDRAVLDALCRLHNLSLQQAIKTNLPGIRTADIAPDLATFDTEVFLASLMQWNSIFARHTVGLTDALTQADITEPLNDGLPETLEQAIQFYGYHHFKLKLAGDVAADLSRLKNIATILDISEQDYFVTLDGNEQYTGVGHISELWQNLMTEPALQRFCQSVLFIEQPINRQVALEQDVSTLSTAKAMIIDESDAELDSFVQAKALGYQGVSSKSCKGIYRSLINAARCAHWNHEEYAQYFLSAEDLSTQAGIALQQDLAVACLLGIEHIERNGHFYVNGFTTQREEEALAFLQTHPGLYCQQNSHIRLQISDGKIDTSALSGIGFARNAEPDWNTMTVMENPKLPA